MRTVRSAEVTSCDAMRADLRRSEARFVVGLADGDMSVELYVPGKRDKQQPHEQDELYVVVRGSALFHSGRHCQPVKEGAVIFVAAQAAHRFTRISDDFETLVVFYGPRVARSSD